ncbi:hypothetical protein [Microcoleus sp. S13C4]|uniref:hypothetical protein n=1 Tax=Microcoleus sp. S13C4 TaxID=3055410 RepID=UPI002FD39325
MTSRWTIKKLALWIAERTYVLTGDREDKAENYFKYCAPTAGADANFHQFR